MKNVTVTLDPETAAWARVYAAQHNKSLSRFLGDLLHTTMRESGAYETAMNSFLAKKPVQLSDGDASYPARGCLYE